MEHCDGPRWPVAHQRLRGGGHWTSGSGAAFPIRMCNMFTIILQISSATVIYRSKNLTHYPHSCPAPAAITIASLPQPSINPAPPKQKGAPDQVERPLR